MSKYNILTIYRHSITKDFLCASQCCLSSSKQCQLERLVWTVWRDHVLTGCLEICHGYKYSALPSGLFFLHWLIKCQSRKGNKILLLPFCSGDMKFKARVPHSCVLTTRKSFFQMWFSFPTPWKAEKRAHSVCEPELHVFFSVAGQVFFLKSLTSFSMLSEKRWLNVAKLCRPPLALSIAQQIAWWWIT